MVCEKYRNFRDVVVTRTSVNKERIKVMLPQVEQIAARVRELRTKSMTIASECMQATRQSNIIREIEKRGIPLKESLEPNRVIPGK